MQLNILGHWAGAPMDGGATSSYLVTDQRTKLLLDCGSGALPLLQQTIEIGELDGILISHMHPDHIYDLLPMTSICFHLKLREASWKKIKLYVPAVNGRQVLKAVDEVMFGNQDRFDTTFDIIEYEEKDVLQIGGLRVSFQRTIHWMPCFSPRITNGRQTLVYSADTAYLPEMIEHAKGADLFLCEATMVHDHPSNEKYGHLTGRQAGEIAAAAGVGRLVLTHLGPEREEREQNWANARQAYPGVVDLAATGAVFRL